MNGFLKCFLLFSFLSILESTKGDPKCPENEKYNPCGKACQSTCTYTVDACSRICDAACFCIEGYVRRSTNGPCIKSSECPSS